MKGDFTRWTFRPEQHYHGVLKQQGRVDLDADWNEQGAIVSHRIETETLDVIGPAGAPAADPGFQLSVHNGQVYISKGRAYIDGLLCENETTILFNEQPDTPGSVLPTAPGYYLAILEVWLRHITAIDDPEIREVALGGPDTCTRAKTVWQVGVLPLDGAKDPPTCSVESPTWNDLTAPRNVTLAARAQPDPTATDPCTIPVAGGYRRLENQLYRVEIHTPGTAGTATYKWSRDNGSVIAKVTSWLAASNDAMTVASLGRDADLGLAAGDWIEILDDTIELWGMFKGGTIVQLANVEGTTLTLNKSTAVGSLDPAHYTHNPKVRRWNSAPSSPALQKVMANTWVDLESGVQVNFTDGIYFGGDYWLIPARTLTADIDWPTYQGNPVYQTPKGIQRHYARLAILELTAGGWNVVSNCLPVFRPLVNCCGGGSTPTTGNGTVPVPVPAVPSIQSSIATPQSFHVTAVNLVGANGNVAALPNDSAVHEANLVGGMIQVVCDQSLDPASAQPTTCFLTVDLPFTAPGVPTSGTGAATILGSQGLILDCAISLNSQGNAIQFTVPPVALDYLRGVLRNAPKRLLTRLTLKGRFLWTLNNPAAYLDGEAFGIKGNQTIDLSLPTNSGVRASDFEMWFWLVPD